MLSALETEAAPAIVSPTPKAMSEDEQDAIFVKDYKKGLESSIIRWWMEADAITKDAFRRDALNLNNLGDVGHLVLDIPFGLANYLRIEYCGINGNWELFDDKDFIRRLQKAVGQTFLSQV